MSDEVFYIKRNVSCPCGCGLTRVLKWWDGDPEAKVIHFPLCDTWAIAKLTAQDAAKFSDPFYWTEVTYGSEKTYDPSG